MRRWTITLREVTPETRGRAEELAHRLWGSSARVLSVDPDERTITLVGPDSESAIRDFRFTLDEAPDDSAPGPMIARRSRGRRWR